MFIIVFFVSVGKVTYFNVDGWLCRSFCLSPIATVVFDMVIRSRRNCFDVVCMYLVCLPRMSLLIEIVEAYLMFNRIQIYFFFVSRIDRNIPLQYPSKDWATLLASSFLGLFVAVPLLYAVCNSYSIPTVDSINNIWDEFTVIPVKRAVGSPFNGDNDFA